MSEAQRWAKTGYDEQTIYRRLFDRDAPALPRSSSSESKESGHTPASSDAWKQGVLFSSVPQDRCKELRNVSDDRLSTNLTLLNDSRVTHFVATRPTPKILRAFVKEVLCPAE